MNEQLSQVLSFANQNPSCWMGTSEDNQPHVRGMLLWFADETGFYYHTAESKRVYKQILKNPRIEVAFIRNQNDPSSFETLHVSGIAETVKEDELEKRLFEERPWLWGNIKNAGVDSKTVIFRITKGCAYIWNMSWNLKESEAPRVYFG